MDVHVVGDDPVKDAVVAALEDVDVGVQDATPSDLEEARFAIVTDLVGAETFEVANEAARDGNTPWIAVEVGGIGGQPLAAVDAAVSGFAPATGCFECLRARVGSTVEDPGTNHRADRSAVRLAGAIAGRECVRVFAGEEQSIIGHVRELPYARHRLLPVPGCACQNGDRDRTLERDDETLALETAVERVEPAIDDRLGPITNIGEVESFPAPYYLASTANTTAFSEAKAPSQSAGVDHDWNAALMKGVGEALERYCAAVYREDDFVISREDDLDGEVVSPTDLVRPDDAPAYDPDEEIRWVVGKNFASGERAYLPAAAVHFPQPGPSYVPQITTGLGLGSSTVDALTAGLTEVLERDAAMIAWYSTYEPVTLEVADGAYDTLVRRARGEGLTVTPLLLTQDVDVPAIAVAVHREIDEDPSDAEWPHFALGSAASLDVLGAARSALAEALQNWMELRGLGPENADSAGGAIGEYASFPARVREPLESPQSLPAESVGPDPVPTGNEALESLIDRTTDAGLTPYAAKLTTRDVASLGFEAVRVVVPGAQPLFTDDPYFGDRARTVPEELGFESRLERAFHPYP